MKDRDRVRPPFGFRYGKTVRCEARGEVEVVGPQEAPVPWPVGKRGTLTAEWHRRRVLRVPDGLREEGKRT